MPWAHWVQGQWLHRSRWAWPNIYIIENITFVQETWLRIDSLVVCRFDRRPNFRISPQLGAHKSLLVGFFCYCFSMRENDLTLRTWRYKLDPKQYRFLGMELNLQSCCNNRADEFIYFKGIWNVRKRLKTRRSTVHFEWIDEKPSIWGYPWMMSRIFSFFN